MTYRLTCLTPLLVGDGNRLAPIDYMVWKDQINVLDQTRIFKLLSRGPRLESYLQQLRRAEKLDFASWGGFAQNYADRRIPFEHASSTVVWERARAENLFIPTFAAGPHGPYLPASALKGVLRTGYVFSRWNDNVIGALKEAAQRRPWRLAEGSEERAGASRLKYIGIADSQPVPASAMRVYLVRTAYLQSRGQNFELGWKTAPRGAVNRAEDSTPVFAEMAQPGTVIEGRWDERAFYFEPEILKALRGKEPPRREEVFDACNQYAEAILTHQREYAERTKLAGVAAYVEALQQRLQEIRSGGYGCLVNLGWGGGYLTKSAYLKTGEPSFRELLAGIPYYARAFQPNLPFPKTRKVVWLGGRPGTYPGWAALQVETSFAPA